MELVVIFAPFVFVGFAFPCSLPSSSMWLKFSEESMKRSPWSGARCDDIPLSSILGANLQILIKIDDAPSALHQMISDKAD